MLFASLVCRSKNIRLLFQTTKFRIKYPDFCCLQKVVKVQYIQSDKWPSTKMSVLLIFLQMHRCSLVPSGSYKNPLCFRRAHRKGQLHPRCCMLMRGLFVRSLCLETR